MVQPKSEPRADGAHKSPDARTGAAIETKLNAICESVLGKQVHRDDNLFQLGTSSLRLIEIHEQIDQAYPGQVDLMELFDFPTVASLARHLAARADPAA